MSRLYKAAFVASAVSFAVIANAAVAGPVEDRKELMKSVGKSLKVAIPMVKGEVPFDAAKAEAAMRTINSVPDKFAKLFPEGSDMHEKTEASPKIWKDMKGFLEKSEALKVASAQAIIAAGKGADAFKASVFGSLVKTCKGCHEGYRIKKEKN